MCKKFITGIESVALFRSKQIRKKTERRVLGVFKFIFRTVSESRIFRVRRKILK